MIRCDYVCNKKDFICLSTEEKTDVDVCDGSTCWEVDTGKLFIYYNGQWYEQP